VHRSPATSSGNLARRAVLLRSPTVSRYRVAFGLRPGKGGERARRETSNSFCRSGAHGFVPRLWAARRIGKLTRTIRVEGAATVLIEEIRDLRLRFGILTEYTSNLVQEPERLAGEPVPMPRAEEARAQSGAGAFDRARRSAKFSESKTLQHADELAAGAVAGPGAGGTACRRDRPAGGSSSSGARPGLTSAQPIGSLSRWWPPSVPHISPWCEVCRS
jgi:hypothetical protein